MSKPQSSLAQITPQQLSQLPKQGIVTIDGKRYQVQLVPHQTAPLAVQQQAIIQRPDPRPSHYQTAQSRGIPQQDIKPPQLPSVLALTLSAVVALAFLVAASMFSISLTAYSNSVDRVDNSRSFLTVE